MKLLIVEDEAKLADYLRKGLAEEGYVVEVASNGVDGLHMATEGSHDLIVLDTMLPGIDGLGLLAALRQSKQTPVIMLTARHRVEDRVRGLKAGADDYLVKPFAFSELVARIEVLLRRAAGAAPAPDALLEHAELAMVAAKKRGAGGVQVFDPTLENASAQSLSLLSQLSQREALVLGGEDRLALLADIDGILDMDRPAIAGPPGHRARGEIISGQQFHARYSASRARAASRSSALDISTTSPTMIRAGERTASRAIIPPMSVKMVRSARPSLRPTRSSTATGVSGESPSAINFSLMSSAVATPI